MPVTVLQPKRETTRHTALVRATHWITVVAFFTLLITGGLIVISHPRFYWGEVGNDNTRPLFRIPIPASRDMVPTGYAYTLPDENGWSRYLHFEAAWVLVLTGLVYGIASLKNGHFRRDVLPQSWSWRAFGEVMGKYLRRAPTRETHSYNALQRAAYAVVIFVLTPLTVWTGLAMSPAFTAAFPATAWLLGGRQSARTMHFFLSWLLLGFVVVHVTMVAMPGFRSRMRGMITGRAAEPKEGA